MNDQLKRLKSEYESMTASDSLRERIQKQFEEADAVGGSGILPEKTIPEHCERTDQRNRWKSWTSIAAMAAIIFLGGLNVSESFAATVSQIPGMEGLVRILTMDRYQFDDGAMTADIVIPQIKGLADPGLEELVNAEIRKDGERMIRQFENDRQWILEEYPEETAHLSLDFNYEVKLDNDELLVLDTYMVESVGSSMVIHKYYNVDKVNGRLLTLPILMDGRADYVAELSQWIRGEMERLNESGEGIYWVKADGIVSADDVFQTISPNETFFINEDGLLVICFDKYEVGPGAMGSPEFVIPSEYFQW
ncbi:MAG: DUF3298 domain-containing protein [Firmicutes bacterium]|nr:DUF3298 domain-containing protein [Bacillota bacterium]MBQ6685699.1 DUF3298 domain-containing protein [Bacillota bacterium]